MSASAIGLSGTAGAQRPAAGAGFFEQAWPARLILASFFLLTLPVVLVMLQMGPGLVTALYLALFGTTHFVITFAIYLRGENLAHFRENRRNRILFFGVPMLIFTAFYLVSVSGVLAAFPVFALVFRGAVRLLDFNHLNRQSFGVLQLFQTRAGVRTAPWLKRAQNWFFMSLTALLYCTYLAGGRSVLVAGEAPGDPIAPLALLRPVTWALLAVSTALLAAVVAGMLDAWRKARLSAGFGEALGYLVLQTASAALPIVSTPLYGAALAMHYVEYHILMFPRCFRSELDLSSKPDRWLAWLRQSPVRFYALLAIVSLGVYSLIVASVNLMGLEPHPGPRSYLLLAAVFDGLFVFHYFVEMYIWRFNDPFFRRTLAGLYFSPQR